MKNQNGVTLISLVVTIILMVILASVVTFGGIDSISSAKRTTFISELEIIQAKVNSIHEQRKASKQDKEYYDSIGQNVSVLGTKLSEILGGSSQDGFKYFSKNDLKNIDIENVNQNVIINFDTREVISVDGIEQDGKKYYKLKDIPNYSGYNVEYIDKNTQPPTFDVEVTKLESTWIVKLKDIVYNSKVQGGTVSYKLNTNSNWIINQNFSFEVKEAGLYDIKLTDKAGNSTIVQKEIQ